MTRKKYVQYDRLITRIGIVKRYDSLLPLKIRDYTILRSRLNRNNLSAKPASVRNISKKMLKKSRSGKAPSRAKRSKDIRKPADHEPTNRCESRRNYATTYESNRRNGTVGESLKHGERILIRRMSRSGTSNETTILRTPKAKYG